MQNLDSVDQFSSHLFDCCKALAAKVEDADRNIKSFMEKATQLESKRSMFLAQSEEVTQFLSKYHMNNSEINLLQKANLDIPHDAKNFFQIFRKLKEAYQGCKQITEKQFYGIGFELLDVLGQHQETAYSRLFLWLKTKCDSLVESTAVVDASGDINSQMQVAARHLKDVPSYLEQCQDLLISARRSQLVQRFMAMLTHGYYSSSKGGPSIGVDIQSGDAAVFLGAMLAWIHQSMAIETEFFEGIYQANPTSSTSSNDADGQPQYAGFGVTELVARTVQGLGRPLRMRIMQLLETNTALEVLYSLADLLSFYQQTFSRVVNMENAVHSTIKGCLAECERLFLTGLRRQAENIRQSPATISSDLKASLITRECAMQVKGILKAVASALSHVSADENSQLYMDTVLGDILQPLLQSCRLGSQSLKPTEMAVFMLNNVTALQVRTSAVFSL